ncbi:VOC family protein [Bacillus sp. N9]
MKIKGLHHISLAVTDLQKSKQFYGSVLGLKELKRPNFEFAGAWFELGEKQLHLIVCPESESLRESGEIITADTHIALSVEANYGDVLQYLNKHHVPNYENTTTRSGYTQIFCLDPDRHIIELNIH